MFNCLTNTVDSSVIQVVPEGAFAAERSIGVDADAVLADAWVIQTLIHICRKQEKALKQQSNKGVPSLVTESVSRHLHGRLPDQGGLHGRRDTVSRKQLEMQREKVAAINSWTF